MALAGVQLVLKEVWLRPPQWSTLGCVAHLRHQLVCPDPLKRIHLTREGGCGFVPVTNSQEGVTALA